MVSRICGQEGGEGVGTGHNLTPAQADVLHGVRCQYVFIVLECLTKSWLCDMALAVVSCAFTICYSDSKCLGLHCMFIP